MAGALRLPFSLCHSPRVVEPIISPWLILAAGVATIVGLIIVVKANAFLALLAAALVVSVLAPGEAGDKAARVATAFGTAAGSIGIVIALASVVGRSMTESGAADRIVSAFLRAFGERRGDVALVGSGYALSIPIFFDTVFYLLVPLARSMTRRTGRHYVRNLLAIAAGACATHTMVPPTPGPLAVAANLGVDLGLLMLVGILVAGPASAVGLLVATWRDRALRIEYRPMPGVDEEASAIADSRLPPLGLSLVPILLPVLLIGGHSILSTAASRGVAVPPALASAAALAGNANFALLVAAVAALALVQFTRRPTRERLASMVEESLMSAGIIILITAAGGAFGAMLRAANVGAGVETLFRPGAAGASGVAVLLLAALMSSVFKVAQGSSTVAMLTTSALFGAMLPGGGLAVHPVYLALAISGGSLVGTWMNDSGFWIFAKMGNLTEAETLGSWTILSASVGLTGIVLTCVLAWLFPMAPVPVTP